MCEQRALGLTLGPSGQARRRDLRHEPEKEIRSPRGARRAAPGAWTLCDRRPPRERRLDCAPVPACAAHMHAWEAQDPRFQNALQGPLPLPLPRPAALL